MERKVYRKEERATGFEPATPSLGSWRSTPELRPLEINFIASGETKEGGNGAPYFFEVLVVFFLDLVLFLLEVPFATTYFLDSSFMCFMRSA